MPLTPFGYWVGSAEVCAANARCDTDFPNVLVGNYFSSYPIGANDEDIPNLCAAGLVGGYTVEEQITPECGGPCEPGTYSKAGAANCTVCGYASAPFPY